MATNNSLTPAASASNPSFGSVPGGLSGVQLGNMGAFHYMPPQQHLVKGQLRGLMANESPFIQQARQAAMELSNARGQANSSYAAGAAQRAAIDAALPIAAQDSETLTRIGLANAANSQRMAELDAQLKAQQGGGSIQMVDPYADERQRAHDLQMQRERLAFEGEQGALGREHDFGMGNFNLMGGLMGDRLRGQWGLGNDLTRMGAQHMYGMDELGARFGHDIGMAGLNNQYGMQNAILGANLGLRNNVLGDYYGNMFGMQRDMMGSRMNLYTNMILQGMQVPEFMADPNAFMGFAEFINGPMWNNLFGAGGWG